MFNLFHKEVEQPKEPVTLYNLWEHNGWGDSIEAEFPHMTDESGQTGIDLDNCKCNGWLPRKPKDGDILRVKMTSGKIFQFRFMEVRHVQQVSDMFFAKLEAVGYEE